MQVLQQKINLEVSKALHFLQDGWFSDTISRRGPTYMISSCISLLYNLDINGMVDTADCTVKLFAQLS